VNFERTDMNDIAIAIVASTRADKAEQGLAGAARRLADASGGRVCAIVLGGAASEIAAFASHVVDRVIVADSTALSEYNPETYLDALAQICRQVTPRALLLSNDTYSQELAPRLAHRLGGSAAGDVVDVRIDGVVLSATRQVYGGKAQAVIALKRTPAVVWLRARSFAPASARDAAAEIDRADIRAGAAPRVRIVERKSESQGETRLEDARVIVAGGRGIGGTEGFNSELQPLAGLLGAQMAASRAACDAGWVPSTWQVGQTGKKVAPDLYLAIGITGASQHMAGISEAKQIAAINTDPDAPIFKHCRFGIVEDYRKVVPLLRQKLVSNQK
jgi:electron transfer flavoprotein alpha subunit